MPKKSKGRLWLIKNQILDTHSLGAAFTVCGLLFVLTTVLHYRSGYNFLKLVLHGLTCFFNYPESAATTPGLIASPSGAIGLRPLPWATFLLAFCGGWLLTTQDPEPSAFWGSLLSRLFGTREEIRYSTTYTNKGVASTARVEEVPRATLLDLQSFSDDPSLSILKITGDRKGYGKYRGIPFVVRSAFHITKAEYEQRKKFQWPDDLPGMMVGSITPPDRGPHGDTAQVDFSDVRATEPESWNSELFE